MKAAPNIQMQMSDSSNSQPQEEIQSKENKNIKPKQQFLLLGRKAPEPVAEED